MINKIKQWLVNYLFQDIRIQQHDAVVNSLPGYTLLGNGWIYTIPGEPSPQPPVVEKVPYIPKYNLRTETEHEAIRNHIQRNPETCPHTKGGRIRGPSTDYNVSCFTFVDGSTQIKCLSCRHVWTPKSPGWKEAQRMISNSTNTPNSCEQPLRNVVFVPLGK